MMSACKNTGVGGEKIEVFFAHHCLPYFSLVSDFSCLSINFPNL